jgi:hypothetical protein
MRQDFKAYALFGKTFWRGRLKVFQHVSYENWIGPTWNVPQFLASSPSPQPAGVAFFGPTVEPSPARSWMVVLSGKLSLGPVSLNYQIPFAEMHQQLTFASTVVPGNATTLLQRHIILEYQDRFWKGKLGLSVKGYWTQFISGFDAQLFPSQAQFPPYDGPKGMNPGGVHFDFSRQYASLIQRTGLALDTDVSLKHGFKILVGGDFFYEGVANAGESFSSAAYGADPANPSLNPSVGPGGTPVATATPGGLPLLCPVRQSGDRFQYLPECPRAFVADQYRLVGALYADLQWRPIAKLALDGGVRLQKGFGGRPYDLTPLYSATVVYNFLPDYHVKANYTTGFRPPVFNNTDAVAGGILYGANPDLKNETSQSFQGELNARLLRNVRKVRELELRVDYSYTFLDNFIVSRLGAYANSGERTIHSVEAFSKLFLNGDHFLTASYTFLYAIASDVGVLRNVPNHWLSLGGSFNLIRNVFDVNANLLVTGVYDDPNRIPGSPSNMPGQTTSAKATDLAFDRLTPVALLQLGFRLRFLKDRLGVSGQLYNVLNQRFYYPDVFYDPTPSVELQPTPAPGFSFFGSVTGRL